MTKNTTTTTTTTIGQGVLHWVSFERGTDRWGSVILLNSNEDRDVMPAKIAVAAGQLGNLIVIFEGRETVLGTGAFFTEKREGFLCVGVRPADGRKHFWLNERAVRLAHEDHEKITLAFRAA